MPPQFRPPPSRPRRPARPQPAIEPSAPPGPGIVSGMGNGAMISMDTDSLSESLDGLGRTGKALGDDWGAISQAIPGRQAGIGAGDLLAGAFRESYDTPAQVVRTSADQIPVRYGELGDAGVAGMTIYIGADRISAAGMPR